MKYIAKQNPPAELKRWFEGQKDEHGKYVNVRYGNLPTELKQRIHDLLIAEQGALCCYTGLRISRKNSHIEHLLPQALCDNYEDVAYNNLLAAFGTERKRISYGAHIKGSWYDSDLLVNPLRKGCEDCFRFDRTGKIKASSVNVKAARTTIEKLCLDHSSLTELRQQAIGAALSQPKTSIRKLEQIAAAYCTPDASGRFRPFCFVVAQVATRSVASAKRRSKQKQSQNKSRKKR